MLENYSVTWGGAGDILVPVDLLGRPDAAFWPLIEIFDADRWGTYVITNRGHQLADPAAFEEWLQRESEKLAQDASYDAATARGMLTEDHIMNNPRSAWLPPEPFAAELQRRTAPAIRQGSVLWDSYRADGGPTGHAPDICDLEPLPPVVRLLDTTGLPADLQVLVAMRTGALSPTYKERLSALGVEIESIQVNDKDLEHVLRFAWSGSTSATARFGLAPSETEFDVASLGRDFLSVTPFGLSILGCARATRRYPGEDDLPIVVVLGSHVDDFAYALSLDRCGLTALWLPSTYTERDDPLARRVVETLASCLWRPGLGRSDASHVVLCSRSLELEAVQSVCDRLRETVWGRDLQVDIADRPAVPPFRLPALLELSTFEEQLEEPFDGDSMQRGVPAALPTAVRAKDPSKLTWWTEVNDPSAALPARSVLNDEVLADEPRWRTITRCGRDGISFYSHSMGLVWGGSTLSQMVNRPRLRFPDASSVFQTLVAAAGFTATESPQGRFRRLTAEMWGGFGPLSEDLAQPQHRRLLRAWLPASGEGERVGLATRSERRFLSFDDAVGVSQLSVEEARVLLDRLLTRGVVRRGYLLKCRHCLHLDWYELENVGQSFSCRRCRTSNAITRDTWLNTVEPTPTYDLAEVVYQAFLGNFEVPVAALTRLKDESRSFGETPELELTDPSGRKFEVDILAIADGRLIVGEAKANDALGKTKREEVQWLRQFRAFAEALTAEEVVFATGANSWREITAQRIDSAFHDSGVMVRTLDDCLRLEG